MNGKKRRAKNKNGMYEFFVQLIEKLNLDKLPNYQKFNVISTAITAVLTLALALPPVLAWVTNIIVAIGNVVIIIVTKQSELVQPINASTFTTVIVPLLFIVVELIICTIYCYFASKINNPPDGDTPNPPTEPQ